MFRLKTWTMNNIGYAPEIKCWKMRSNINANSYEYEHLHGDVFVQPQMVTLCANMLNVVFSALKAFTIQTTFQFCTGIQWLDSVKRLESAWMLIPWTHTRMHIALLASYCTSHHSPFDECEFNSWLYRKKNLQLRWTVRTSDLILIKWQSEKTTEVVRKFFDNFEISLYIFIRNYAVQIKHGSGMTYDSSSTAWFFNNFNISSIWGRQERDEREIVNKELIN